MAAEEFSGRSNRKVGEADSEPAVAVALGVGYGMVRDLLESNECPQQISPFRTNEYMPHRRSAATNSLPKAETAVSNARENPLASCSGSLQGQQVLLCEAWARVSHFWHKRTSRGTTRDIRGLGLEIVRTVRSAQSGLDSPAVAHQSKDWDLC